MDYLAAHPLLGLTHGGGEEGVSHLVELRATLG